MVEQNKSRTRNSKQTNTAKKTTPKKKKKSNTSFTLLFIVFAAILFIIGAMIGYGYLGEKDPLEVLDMDTWIHMYNLIFG